jgi:hemolysin III
VVPSEGQGRGELATDGLLHRLPRAIGRLSLEERANTLTHGAGIGLSLGGLAALAAQAVVSRDALHTAAVGVYGLSLVAVYAASTLCHLATGAASLHLRRRAVALDHACVYLLIAGTYTPFLLTPLRGAGGGALLIAVWLLGAAGAGWKALGRWQSERLSVAGYLALGWLILPAVGPLAAAVGPVGMGLLVAGGLCYTGGVGFFFAARLPFAHAAWHLCVLAGSALHYAAVLLYAAP